MFWVKYVNFFFSLGSLAVIQFLVVPFYISFHISFLGKIDI